MYKYLLIIAIVFRTLNSDAQPLGGVTLLRYNFPNSSHHPGEHKKKKRTKEDLDKDMFKNLEDVEFSGFLVFDNDTFEGKISYDAKDFVMPCQKDSFDYFDVDDTHLKYVFLDAGDSIHKITLERLGNNKIYRLLHNGKLQIFDTYYTFDYHSKEIFKKDMAMMYKGKMETIDPMPIEDCKRKLVSFINKIYGLHIKPEDYDENGLLLFIQKLN
jgi:hypothetical protein